MNNIILTGQLICQDANEVAVVTELLTRHLELTRAEPGCISFEVNPTDDPRVWDVRERFADVASFELHQERAKASEWGRATTNIERRYSISGLPT